MRNPLRGRAESRALAAFREASGLRIIDDMATTLIREVRGGVRSVYGAGRGTCMQRAGAIGRGGELLTSSEVGELFGVHRRTVVLWAKGGRPHALCTPGVQHRFRANEIGLPSREPNVCSPAF